MIYQEMTFHQKKKTVKRGMRFWKVSKNSILLEFTYYVLFYKGLFSLEKSDILNFIPTFSCILLSKKAATTQLLQNYIIH